MKRVGVLGSLAVLTVVIVFGPQVIPGLGSDTRRPGWDSYPGWLFGVVSVAWMALAMVWMGLRRRVRPPEPQLQSSDGPLSKLAAAERELHEHDRE